MGSYDAIVIGAGPNGLVAANRLADAGWTVLVVEAQPHVGGAVHSSRELSPEYVHDTFSSFYPLAAASRAVSDLNLEEHGLVWEHAPAVVGHPMADGRWALLHRDRETTAGLMEEHEPGDGAAWLELCALWDRLGDPVVRGLTGPFPPVRPAWGTLRQLIGPGGMDLVRTLVSPAPSIGRSRFAGDLPGMLISGNAGHADIPLTSPGSGLFGLLMTMLGQTVGFPVPRGGAGELSAALCRRFEARGGQVVTGSAVRRVLVEGGRASGVLTEHERHTARRAVVADVSALHLFGSAERAGLLEQQHVPSAVRRGMAGFELDPATVKVDWALSGPVPWSSPPPYQPGTVHVADSVDEMMLATAQVASHTIAARPFLLVGQMTTSDPTRSPIGTESLWAYTHVPHNDAPVRDAGDGSIRGVWDGDDCERFADRMQQRIEALAPGFSTRIVARRVLGPRELEARNANLIGGSVNGGSSQLHHELIFRPVPALLGRPETGVRGLYLGSASAHPGGGVHGAPGANAARAALLHDRLRLRLRR